MRFKKTSSTCIGPIKLNMFYCVVPVLIFLGVFKKNDKRMSLMCKFMSVQY